MTDSAPSPALRALSLTAAIVTGLTVMLGSMVCAMDASAACPNWPGCYVGSVLPSGELPPLLEFTHRVVAILTTPAILATAILGRKHRSTRLRVLPWISLLCALAAGTFGMMIIKFTLPMPLAVLDLSLSLVALSLTTATAFAAFRRTAPREGGLAPTAWFAYGVVGVLLVAHGLGIVVAGEGEYVRCMSWPTEFAASGGFEALRLGLFLAAAVGLVLNAVLVARARRRPSTLTFLPIALLAATGAYALAIKDGAGAGLLAGFSVLAVAVFWSAAIVAGSLVDEDASQR